MNEEQLVNVFRKLKSKTMIQESIRKGNSPYRENLFDKKAIGLLNAIYENETKLKNQDDFCLYNFEIDSDFASNSLSYKEVIYKDDATFSGFMKSQLKNTTDDFIIELIKLMNIETLRPLHEKSTIGEHGLKSTILYQSGYLEDYRIDLELKKDILVATRHGLLVHDIGKILHQKMPGSHNNLGIVVIRKHPWIIPSRFNERQKSIVNWIISYHDVGGRLARGISNGEFNPCEYCDMVKICTKYKSAIDKVHAKKFIESLNIPELSYEQKVGINMKVYEADVGSVRLLSRGIKSIPFIEELLLS